MKELINRVTKKFREDRLVYLVLLVALFVRLIHIIEITQTRPYYEELRVDATAYDSWGQDIAAGDIIGSGVFYQDPLYPYFLGFIYSIFGHNLFIVVLIQAVIGALTTSLVFLIGRNLVNNYVGVIAALLWAIHPPIIFYEGLIQKEGLSVFLTTLSIYLLIVARESRYYSHWFLSGFFIGLSVLTRGNIILVIPFIFLWLVFVYKKNFVSFSLVFLFGLLTVLMPVAVRNKIVGGEFVLTTSQAGANFYWGNNKDAVGSFFPAPAFLRTLPPYEQEDFAKEAIRLSGNKSMSNSEISRFWFKKGLEFITENPGQYVWLQYQKLVLLFNKTEISDNYQYYYFKRFSSVLSYSPFSVWLIASFGLLGMVLSIQNWARLSLLYIFTIIYSLSILIFFVMSRYRLPMMPILTIFAACALYRCWEQIYERKYTVLGLIIVLEVVFAAFVGKDIPWLTGLNSHEALISEAKNYYKHGDYEKASVTYIKTIESFPLSFASHEGLGDIGVKKRSFNEAIYQYKKALEIDPNLTQVPFKLGMVYIELDRVDEAIKEFQKLAATHRNQPYSYIGLATAFERKGMLDLAVKNWEEYLRLYPSGDMVKFARDRVEQIRKALTRIIKK